MMEIRTALKCFNQRKCRFLTPCFYVCKRPVSISVKRGFYARKIPPSTPEVSKHLPGLRFRLISARKPFQSTANQRRSIFLLRLWGTAEKSMPCSTKPKTLKRGRTVWSKHSCTLAVFRDTWFVITRKPSFINRQPMVNQSSTTSDSKQFVATGVRILKPVSPTIQRKKAK